MKLAGMDRSRLRSPLAQRLIVAIILFSSAITLILTVIQLYGQYRNDVNDIETDLAQIERVHLKTLTQSLWATNSKDLALQLEGLVQVPNFEYVAVHEGEKLWAQAGQRTPHTVIERSYPMIYQHRDTTRQIGTLSVVVSLDAVYQHLLNQAFLLLASNALKTFLVAGFMFAYFHWLVNRHLLSVTGYMRGLDPHRPAPPLALSRPPRRRPDEFDELTAAINGMNEKTYAALTALSTSEQRFHAIADYTVDWENWVGPDGKLIWVNSSVERLTGYSPQECLAMPDFPLALVDEEDVEHSRAEFTRSVKGGVGIILNFASNTRMDRGSGRRPPGSRSMALPASSWDNALAYATSPSASACNWSYRTR